jgi:hypothetical protein
VPSDLQYLTLSVYRRIKRLNEFFEPEEEEQTLYSWAAQEDLFAAAPTEATERIRNAFPDASQSLTLPELEDLIQTIGRSLSEATWSVTQEARRLPNGATLNLRLHGLLAFKRHLQWIRDTFEHIPNMQVRLR